MEKEENVFEHTLKVFTDDQKAGLLEIDGQERLVYELSDELSGGIGDLIVCDMKPRGDYKVTIKIEKLN